MKKIVPSGGLEPFCGDCAKELEPFLQYTLYPVHDWSTGWRYYEKQRYALLCDDCAKVFWEAEAAAIDAQDRSEY